MPNAETEVTAFSQRPQRADARRNYEKLISAARDAFTEDGASASLEDIARRAQVGIGTLYRHFPTRQHLLEAVYVDEVEAICRAAPTWLTSLRGTRSSRGCARSSASPPPNARSPRRCSPRSTPTPRSSAPAASRSRPPASRCSSAPRRREPSARTRTSRTSHACSAASPRSSPTPSDRAHPRPRARRPALPARPHLTAGMSLLLTPGADGAEASVLDQSPIAEGGTGGQALRNTVDLARLADELGYARYWVAEHHGCRCSRAPRPRS